MSRKKIKDAVPVGSILDDVFHRMGLKPALSRQSIVYLWPKIVNSAVARHAVAEKIVGSTLHVAVDSSVWMNELAAIKDVLLGKVNSCLEASATPITDIRFFQRSYLRRSPTRTSPRVYPQLTDDDLRMIRGALEPVKDEALRTVLKEILEKDRRLKLRGREPI
ncbi:MAG: DUF721 domain-containing protein [Deltaproteobacteria bacterium]